MCHVVAVLVSNFMPHQLLMGMMKGAVKVRLGTNTQIFRGTRLARLAQRPLTDAGTPSRLNP
jgi:hypothetical protein